MNKQYWAERGSIRIGPYATHDEALNAFRLAYPFNGAQFEASIRRNKILTGYGTYGAHFDMRWHDAAEQVD